MKSVDNALHEYTDSIANNTECNIKSFEPLMTPEDYVEFVQLTAFSDLVIESKHQANDIKLFQVLNSYKKKLYDVPAVANFRSEDGHVTKEAEDTLRNLFEEEFKDD